MKFHDAVNIKILRKCYGIINMYKTFHVNTEYFINYIRRQWLRIDQMTKNYQNIYTDKRK